MDEIWGISDGAFLLGYMGVIVIVLLAGGPRSRTELVAPPPGHGGYGGGYGGAEAAAIEAAANQAPC